MNVPFERGLEIWQSTLWRATWQGAIVVLVALAVERAWVTMPPAWRSWLWRLVFVKLAFICLLPISIALPILPYSAPVIETAGTVAPTAIDIAGDGKTTTIGAIPQNRRVGRSQYWLGGLAIVWLLGVAANIYVGRRNMHRIVQHWRQSRVLAHASIWQMLEPLQRRFGLRHTPMIRWTMDSISPCVLNRRGPTILLPAGWLQTCTASQLGLALAHELAHLVRGDLIWNRFAAACRAAFFFHPLVWLASRRHLAAQELACDELALRATDGSPAEYAQLLLQFVDQPSCPPWCGVASMTGNVSLLQERIRTMANVLRSQKFSGATSWAVAFLAMLSLVPFSLAQQPSAPGSAKAAKGDVENGSGRDGAGINESKKATSAEEKSPSADKDSKKQTAEIKKKPGTKRSAKKGDGNIPTRRTEATDNDNRNVKIEQNASEIRVVIKDENGETVVVAKDMDDLKRKSPAAFELFQKFAGDIGNNFGGAAGLGQLPIDLNQGPQVAKDMMRQQLKQLKNSDDVRGTPLEDLLNKLEQQVDGLNDR